MQPTDQIWVAAQNRQTQAWLRSPARGPIRQWVAECLRQLNAALPQLETQADVSTSPDGQWRATVTNYAGSDLHSCQLWQGEGESAQPQECVVDLYPTGIAWRSDSSGFYYDRYLPYPGHHALYFHRAGTAQRQDRCIFYHAEHPNWYYQPTVSPDGRWLAITTLNHSANNQLTLLPLPGNSAAAAGMPIVIAPDFSGRYDILHWQPDRLILRAVEPDAPNGRLLVVDLDTVVGARHAVPLRQNARPLVDAIPFGRGWVVHYLNGGCSELHLYDEQGHSQTIIPLPGLGTVLWLATKGEPLNLCYGYTEHVRPPQTYCWQPGQAGAQLEGAPHPLPYTPDDFLTRQEWIVSADGTRVLLFLTHHRAVKPFHCPTLLTAYGGLGHAHTPHFSADAMSWLLASGCLVTACVRGGSELGAGWHQAAVGVHKQRTFDDLLAAARWLIGQGITTPQRLGLWGVSNGGLTVAAALTQAPQLFGAAVIESALLDMLAYHQLGQGANWIAEYGSPDKLDERNYLASYSPLHNLRHGAHYPATLITTHACDPRVGAAHSLCFAAALQQAQGGDAPTLLRVDPGSGHGDGPEHGSQIAAASDRLTFFADHLGLRP